MSWLRRSKPRIPYDMFNLEHEAEAAARLGKCESIYHRGQQLAWNGKEVLPMLLEKHGGVRIGEREKQALERIFSLILWGELAAWKISAQLADELVPLEAKMAATSQAFDEARHFYTIRDYLRELGYVPKRLRAAPEFLLELVLGTDNLAYKLVGMQLMVETIALGIFQAVRENQTEPVLSDLMRYFERDEARHVGLGMQYLPILMRDWKARDVVALVTFQLRLLAFALWDAKSLEPDFRTLNINPRLLIERVRKKQLAAIREAYHVVGVEVEAQNLPANRVFNAVVELLFPPTGDDATMSDRLRASWAMLSRGFSQEFGEEQFAVHENAPMPLDAMQD